MVSNPKPKPKNKTKKRRPYKKRRYMEANTHKTLWGSSLKGCITEKAFGNRSDRATEQTFGTQVVSRPRVTSLGCLGLEFRLYSRHGLF